MTRLTAADVPTDTSRPTDCVPRTGQSKHLSRRPQEIAGFACRLVVAFEVSTDEEGRIIKALVLRGSIQVGRAHTRPEVAKSQLEGILPSPTIQFWESGRGSISAVWIVAWV